MLGCKLFTTDIHSLHKSSFLESDRASCGWRLPFPIGQSPLLPLEKSRLHPHFLPFSPAPILSHLQCSSVPCPTHHSKEVLTITSWEEGKKKPDAYLVHFPTYVKDYTRPSFFTCNSKVSSYGNMRPYFLLSKGKKRNCTQQGTLVIQGL